MSIFYNSIETQRTCFLFLLENTVMKKGKQLVNFDYQNLNLFAHAIITSTTLASSVFLLSWKHNF